MRNDSDQNGNAEDLDALARDAAEWAQASDEPASGALTDELKQLQESLAQKQKEAAIANDKYLRTYAEFENYRKRMQRDLAEARKYAHEPLLQELLPVMDHLGLALRHAQESDGANQGFLEGVQLVYKQFRDVLEKFGVKPFDAEGKPFDPVMHDAVMQVPTADVPENTVVQVLQGGYLYHDKVVRHAKVGVSKRPTETASDPDSED